MFNEKDYGDREIFVHRGIGILNSLRQKLDKLENVMDDDCLNQAGKNAARHSD